ncbi:hypothetical protein CDAR_555721 [Caerostris darwini]|uniref:Uncharacterized protein n=1 Tax=Caerostris darwini TaxID=1538125 RepID=A0AAV4QVJ5_9ARAC|nr:hypothetical protein CDAR_555721 [Caerostris darwini]
MPGGYHNPSTLSGNVLTQRAVLAKAHAHVLIYAVSANHEAVCCNLYSEQDTQNNETHSGKLISPFRTLITFGDIKNFENVGVSDSNRQHSFSSGEDLTETARKIAAPGCAVRS